MTDEFGFKTPRFQQFYKSIVNSINSMKTEPNKKEEVQQKKEEVQQKLESLKILLLEMEDLLPQKESRKKYFTEFTVFNQALRKFNFNAAQLEKVHWRFWELINKKNDDNGNTVLSFKDVQKIPDDELIQSIILRLRFFIDESENMSIEKIAESYEKGDFENIQKEDKDGVAKIYQDFKSFINPKSDDLVKHTPKVDEPNLEEPNLEELSFEEAGKYWGNFIFHCTEKILLQKLLEPASEYARLKGIDVNLIVLVREEQTLQKMTELMQLYFYGYYAHQDEHNKFLEKLPPIKERQEEFGQEICKIFFVTLLLRICECIFNLALINKRVIGQHNSGL